jgi:hypothetical protein
MYDYLEGSPAQAPKGHCWVIPRQVTKCFQLDHFQFCLNFDRMLSEVIKEVLQNFSSLSHMVAAPGPPVWMILMQRQSVYEDFAKFDALLLQA